MAADSFAGPHAWIELARFNEDLVSKDEVAEHRHQRLRRLLGHLDDDDAIVIEGQSNPQVGRDGRRLKSGS